MEKENCPACKSERTNFESSGTYAGYWVCSNQGCDGKLAADRFFWKPGAGLAPKPVKKKKAAAEPAEDVSSN